MVGKNHGGGEMRSGDGAQKGATEVEVLKVSGGGRIRLVKVSRITMNSIGAGDGFDTHRGSQRACLLMRAETCITPSLRPRPHLPGHEEELATATVDDARVKSPREGMSDGFAPILERNISALLARRRVEERRRSIDERIAAAIARFTGSMRFVYVHLVFFGAWIVINLRWTPLPPFDPTFVVLAMVASVEAIFLSTFVLITQNRIAAEADRRADLDLQISLLAEHEITRLVQIVSEIGKRIGVQGSGDPELEPLKHDVSPEEVLDRLDDLEKDGKSTP
jgi:uncharacterized membrane protein